MQAVSEEEKDAVKYLIALGIIDPEKSTLPYAHSLPFTNEDLVEILYRVDNKEARFNNMVALSDIDKEMSDKGYSQARIDISNSTVSNYQEPTYIKATDENGNSISVAQRIENDFSKNPSEYDFIYIRMPEKGDNVSNNIGLYSMTNNRQIIPSINPKRMIMIFSR